MLIQSFLWMVIIFVIKALFDNYGLYDESYKILADYDFNLKVLIKNKVPFSVIKRKVAVFTLGGISTSEKHHEVFLQEREIIQKKYFSKIMLKINTRINKLFRKQLRNGMFRTFICFLLDLNMKKLLSES